MKIKVFFWLFQFFFVTLHQENNNVMAQTDKEVLELCKEWFEDIMEKCVHLTSGNVSHNGRAIHCYAKNCAEFY